MDLEGKENSAKETIKQMKAFFAKYGVSVIKSYVSW
jgi:hypothetical protein